MLEVVPKGSSKFTAENVEAELLNASSNGFEEEKSSAILFVVEKKDVIIRI